MKTIGSHPGAILFRLGSMITVIAILVVVFLRYVEETQKEVERASILQMKNIIDSSLAVVFATYAVKGRLDDLNELDGGNPFEFLAEYSLITPAYMGEIYAEVFDKLDPGWYYLTQKKRVLYVSRYTGTDTYFRITLRYQDNNQSGRYESDVDGFQVLQFVKTPD
jgi:hypothetical protein